MFFRFVFLSFLDGGELFTWGQGQGGRLGHGDDRIRFVISFFVSLRYLSVYNRSFSFLFLKTMI